MNTLGFIMNQLMRPAMAEHMAKQGEPMLEGAARLFGKEDLSDPAMVGVIRDWLEEAGSPMAGTIDQYILGRPEMVAKYDRYAPLEYAPERLAQWGLPESPNRGRYGLLPSPYNQPYRQIDPLAENVDGYDWSAYAGDASLNDLRFRPDLAGYSLASTGGEIRPDTANAAISFGQDYGPDMLPRMRGFGQYLEDYGDPRAIPNAYADGWVPPAIAVPTHFRPQYLD